MPLFARSIMITGLFAGCASLALANLNFTTISIPSATFGTSASGINNSDQISGSYGTFTFQNGEVSHGFLDTGGTFTSIDVPSSRTTSGSGGNDLGEVVGTYYDAAGAVHGFVYNSGAFTTIDDPLAPGKKGTNAFGINNAGQVVGYYQSGSGNQAFLDNGGTFTDIKDPMGFGTQAFGINNKGAIVGIFENGSGNEAGTHGFVDVGGVFTTIDDPLATVQTSPSGINDAGDIVGTYQTDNAILGFVDINGTFITVADPTGLATSASGINNAGEIVGSYLNANAPSDGFLATGNALAPEPSYFAIILTAFLGLAGYSVWKRRAIH